jgi:hypothetical protein
MRVVFYLAATFGLVLSASAEVPQQLHYNGFLTNAVGEAVDCSDPLQCADSYDLSVRIYASETSTVPLWDELHTAVPIYSGSFHMVLGQIAPITPDTLDGPVWLGIRVNTQPEMTPRQKVVSSPFAIRANTAGQADEALNASQLGGLSAEDYATQSTVSELQANLDQVALQGLPPDLADGDDDTLGTLVCGEGMVAKANSIGLWTCGNDESGSDDTTLSEAEVDAFVANNGYSMGAHTVDTTLSVEDVQNIISVAGYVSGPHTVDTNTQLTEAEVDAFVANNDYSVGPHTVDTNTQLTEAEVDAFVENNGYAAESALTAAETTLQANIDAEATVRTAADTALQTQITVGSTSSGEVITHWGTPTCPSSFEKLYDGVLFATHYTHAGSEGALCLMSNESGAVSGPGEGGSSYDLLYSVRIDHKSATGVPNSNNVRCSKCYTPDKGPCFRVENSNACPGDWDAVYSGFLFGSNHGHSGPMGRICVDVNNWENSGQGSASNYHYATTIHSADGTGGGAGYSNNTLVRCAWCCRP